ncbi:MAG: gamma-glutamylcyclotransferase family protein [Granulosicoccus sp.]
MSSQWINYFGYGSLVNRDTRPKGEEAINVTLKGWRRVWNHRVTNTDARLACTSLSVEPAQGSIDGVLVRIPLSELDGLDAREYGYERMGLSATDFVLPNGVSAETIYIYRSLEVNRLLADDEHPIAQSYVDCVMAGYLRRFGEEGLQQLLRSTRGWNLPTLPDRGEPTYPRHVSLSDARYQHFDRLLAAWR